MHHCKIANELGTQLDQKSPLVSKGGSDHSGKWLLSSRFLTSLALPSSLCARSFYSDLVWLCHTGVRPEMRPISVSRCLKTWHSIYVCKGDNDNGRTIQKDGPRVCHRVGLDDLLLEGRIASAVYYMKNDLHHLLTRRVGYLRHLSSWGEKVSDKVIAPRWRNLRLPVRFEGSPIPCRAAISSCLRQASPSSHNRVKGVSQGSEEIFLSIAGNHVYPCLSLLS